MAVTFQSTLKRINVIKLTIGQLVYFQTFQILMRKLFTINFANTLIINFFLANVDFLKPRLHSLIY